MPWHTAYQPAMPDSKHGRRLTAGVAYPVSADDRAVKALPADEATMQLIASH